MPIGRLRRLGLKEIKHRASKVKESIRRNCSAKSTHLQGSAVGGCIPTLCFLSLSPVNTPSSGPSSPVSCVASCLYQRPRSPREGLHQASHRPAPRYHSTLSDPSSLLGHGELVGTSYLSASLLPPALVSSLETELQKSQLEVVYQAP